MLTIQHNCVNRDYWRLTHVFHRVLGPHTQQVVCVVLMHTGLHNDHKNNNCVNRDYWRLLELNTCISQVHWITYTVHMPRVLHNDHKNNTPCTVLTQQQVVMSYTVLHETMWISKGIMGLGQLFTYEMDVLDTQTVMATT